VNIRPEANRFLDEVEKFAGERFFYREELARLTEIAEAEKKRAISMRLSFYRNSLSKPMQYSSAKEIHPNRQKNSLVSSVTN